MSEILLQTIVEKLESLEIALLKESNTSNDEVLQKQALQNFKSLRAEIQMFIFSIEQPQRKIKCFLKRNESLKIKLR